MNGPIFKPSFIKIYHSTAYEIYLCDIFFGEKKQHVFSQILRSV